VKLLVHKRRFFTNDSGAWNMFDLVLVSLSVVDLATSYVFDLARFGIQPNFLRILRLLRLTKMFRTIRLMRGLKALRMIVDCIANSLNELFWSIMSLLMFYFFFVVILLNGVASVLSDDDVQESDKDDLLQHWGSVPDGILTLYKVTTGGGDWGEIAESLLLAGRVNYTVFLLFIAFITIAVFNILTGIYVDSAMKYLALDRTTLIYDELEDEHRVVSGLTRMFRSFVQEMRGELPSGLGASSITLSIAEIRLMFKRPEVQAYSTSLGMDAWDVEFLLEVLVAKQSGDLISLPVFVHTCMQAKGTAKAIDLHHLNMNLDSVKLQISDVRRAIARLGEHVEVML